MLVWVRDRFYKLGCAMQSVIVSSFEMNQVGCPMSQILEFSHLFTLDFEKDRFQVVVEQVDEELLWLRCQQQDQTLIEE